MCFKCQSTLKFFKKKLFYGKTLLRSKFSFLNSNLFSLTASLVYVFSLKVLGSLSSAFSAR